MCFCINILNLSVERSILLELLIFVAYFSPNEATTSVTFPPLICGTLLWSWGWAEPGEVVASLLDGETVNATFRQLQEKVVCFGPGWKAVVLAVLSGLSVKSEVESDWSPIRPGSFDLPHMNHLITNLEKTFDSNLSSDPLSKRVK